MIIKLKGGDKNLFGHSIQKMDHDVHMSGLFSDENLVRALDIYPSENLEIFTHGSAQACMRGDASSAELLEAVKRGWLRVNLKHIESVPTTYGRLSGHMHKAFSKHVGLFTNGRTASLQISSESAPSVCEADLKDVMLWQLRGRKRVDIYPNKAPFIHPEDMQRMALGGHGEKIALTPDLDGDNIGIDLEPGDLLCWPHCAPHRSVNTAGLNVSLRLECLTLNSRARVGAAYFDGYCYEKYKKSWATADPALPATYMKAIFAAFLKWSSEKKATRPPSVAPAFKVNLKRPSGMEQI